MMSTTAQDERLDVLLALAVALADEGDDGGAARDPLSVLAALGDEDREAAAARLSHYERLTVEQQESWLRRQLLAAEGDERQLRLDPQIDQSHVVEAIRGEPPRVRALIMRTLPDRLKAACAQELGLPRHAPEPKSRGARERSEPHPRVSAVVRRSFLRRFVSASQLRQPTHLDLLPRATLARLVRLLGVRELALAVRGASQVANVGSLWRRLPPEDSSVFAAQMTSLEEFEPGRVSFAEEVVGEAFNFAPDPVAVSNHAGLRLLALAMRSRDPEGIGYTAQKFPVGVAVYFRDLLSHPIPGGDEAQARALAAEVEQLAEYSGGASREGAPRR